MRRLNLFEYDMDTDEEHSLFSLILDGGKITADNKAGEEYLSQLAESYDLGILHRDVLLYGRGEYEALFDLLEKKARNPHFYVKA